MVLQDFCRCVPNQKYQIYELDYRIINFSGTVCLTNWNDPPPPPDYVLSSHASTGNKTNISFNQKYSFVTNCIYYNFSSGTNHKFLCSVFSLSKINIFKFRIGEKRFHDNCDSGCIMRSYNTKKAVKLLLLLKSWNVIALQLKNLHGEIFRDKKRNIWCKIFCLITCHVSHLKKLSWETIRIFIVCAPPPQYFMPPPPHQIQSTCLYIVNHYVKIWHTRLGCK